jgi:serine/threonine protein kinase
MKVEASISYTKIRQIGTGKGMNSKVFLVDDHQFNAYVAAKEIKKTDFPNAKSYFEETQTMYAVGHDRVVPVHYACQTDDMISVVMPHFDKGSLEDRIDQAPLKLSEALNVAQDVLAGVAHIHSLGYVHLDIKPSNILFSNKNRAMVADFGQSREISSTGVVSVPSVYNLAMPPETIATQIATPLSDIYHVGLLMYRCLNGNKFFSDQTPPTEPELKTKIRNGKFPDRKKFMPHVPKRLRTLVRKALLVDPTQRFRTATEMADALATVSISLDWSIEPISSGELGWRAKRAEKPDLVVELTEDGAEWTVETFTESEGEPRRAKDRAANWRKGLSRGDAFVHLEKVFQRLLR